MSDDRIIKKYPNRRLYDTETKAYITLEDVRQLVKDNINFRVLDSNSKKDLTQSTLLQIIIEQEAGRAPLFTTSLLRNFIRFYDQKPSQLFSQYIEQAMQAFHQQQELFKDPFSAYQEFLRTQMTKAKKHDE
jgi:polyhydroxyalkanoate synthesis repressor PhaR